MKSLSFAALIALQLALAPPAAAKLSKAESGMAQTVKAERDRSIALLEKLVNQNSGSPNTAGVEQAGQMMPAELAPRGFKVEWKTKSVHGPTGTQYTTNTAKPNPQRTD